MKGQDIYSKKREQSVYKIPEAFRNGQLYLVSKNPSVGAVEIAQQLKES